MMENILHIHTKKKTTRKTFFKTVNVLDFIGKLVQHINKKHFKSIRRFGLYSRRLNRLSIQIVNLFNFIKQRNINDLIKQNINKKSNFRDRLVEKFTLIKKTCSICSKSMDLFRIWLSKYGTIYETKLSFEIFDKNPNKQNLILTKQEQLILF